MVVVFARQAWYVRYYNYLRSWGSWPAEYASMCSSIIERVQKEYENTPDEKWKYLLPRFINFRVQP